MAKKKQGGGESKVPLVLALAFFVMSTIAVGVLAYNYQEQIETANKNKKDADEAAASAESRLAIVEDRLMLHQVALGVLPPDKDDPTKPMDVTAAVEKLNRSKNLPLLLDDHTRIVNHVNSLINTTVASEKTTLSKDNPATKFDIKPEALFNWTWPMTAGPVVPMPVRMVQLISEREQGLRFASDAVTAYKQKFKESETARGQYDDAKKVFPAQLAAKTKEVEDYKAQKDAEIKARSDSYTALMAQYTKKKNEADDKIGPLEKNLDLTRVELANAREELKNIKSSINPTKFVQFDNPTGAITASFTKDKIVEIDLGSADKVRVGLTFTVYPREAKDRGSEKKAPKAMIEVVEVLAPNLSRARVTAYEDEIRNPLTKGDLLYNIAWQKGRADHVVLFGIFDIDGDGTDDIKTVRNDLMKMGVVVDGIYDLATRKWDGNPPSYRTDYAIVGNMPSTYPNDSLAGPKGELITAINKAEGDAKEKSVNVIRARDFFGGIGYKIKTDITDDAINQAAAKYLKAPEPEAPKN